MPSWEADRKDSRSRLRGDHPPEKQIDSNEVEAIPSRDGNGVVCRLTPLLRSCGLGVCLLYDWIKEVFWLKGRS
jgi:hypothetical protein